ncbi:riboflavin synthase alpha chain [Nitrosospira sp. Nl5]|uniref:riboflavin synthase n=1 Tax=Nitrosospira sp. Nl5 TaxID=200120 RepID=UPI000888BC47|nr:riboflavin synthase [Nitrosospira sp. Nl5]SCY59364.1 riboflavin synthase alpha chain [Nitrosospira sp. Nl5]
MFTGIIEAIGEIKHTATLEDGLCLRISPGLLDLGDVKIGDSIAAKGVCLTVTALMNDTFSVDVSRETLNCTEGLDKAGGRVNLEKAMRLSDRLDGHLVSGHVDGIGEVAEFKPAGESYLLVIKAPGSLSKYIAKKGSITVDGVSLTVNGIAGDEFEVNLIRHTLAVTTLCDLEPGAKVNLEVDMVARYVERLMDSRMNCSTLT